MRIATRAHAAVLGLQDVWDREHGPAPERPATGQPGGLPGTSGGRQRVRAVNDLGQNKTEAAFDAHLAGLKAEGLIRDYKFELLKWRLAGRTWLKIDFAVWLHNWRLIAIDVKGWLEDDAAVKVKVLAEQCPGLGVYLAKRVRGTWEYRHCGRSGIVQCGEPF